MKSIKTTLAESFKQLEEAFDRVSGQPGAAKKLLAGIEGGFARMQVLAAALSAASKHGKNSPAVPPTAQASTQSRPRELGELRAEIARLEHETDPAKIQAALATIETLVLAIDVHVTASTAAVGKVASPRVAGAAGAAAQDELAGALAPPGPDANFEAIHRHYLALVAHGRSLEAGRFHAMHAKRFQQRS